MSKILSKELFKSLIKRYESQIQSNKTMMMIYFDKSVGIGEHPQHIEELDKMLEEITEANDKLEYLQSEISFENYK